MCHVPLGLSEHSLLRLLRTRFEIKDTGIENDSDLFFFLGGGGGEEVRYKTVRT